MSKSVYFFIFVILGLNLTAFSVFLQLDFLVFNAPLFKTIFWLSAALSWVMAYRFRPQ